MMTFKNVSLSSMPNLTIYQLFRGNDSIIFVKQEDLNKIKKTFSKIRKRFILSPTESANEAILIETNQITSKSLDKIHDIFGGKKPESKPGITTYPIEFTPGHFVKKIDFK